MNPFWLTVTAGDLNIGQQNVNFRRIVRNVTRSYVHPLYLHANNIHDIAVLRVGEPFPLPHNSIEPAIRTTRTIVTGTTCQFAAWGANTAALPLNHVQQTINLPIRTDGACTITPQTICVGFTTTPNPFVCHVSEIEKVLFRNFSILINFSLLF